MTNSQINEQSIVDQLADFTDRILSENKLEQDEVTFAPDPDLRALELTAQRLKAVFEGGDPDEAVIQNMHNTINEKLRQQESRISNTIWQQLTRRFNAPKQKWTSQQSRKRFSIVASLATLVVVLLVAIPSLTIFGTDLSGASGQNPNTYVLIALGGLILLAMWLFRRRP